jgi:hypothetical protein
MPQIYGRLQFGASLNIWCILWCFFSCECQNLCNLAVSILPYCTKNKNGSHYYILVVISTISPPDFTKTSYPRREREREERSGDKMIMMEYLGLSFLDRKVTKLVTNSASIRRLARHSGITVDASLRLSLYKTKAQAKQEHWNYHSRRAPAVVKKSRVPCKRRKKCWHTKLLERQQDSAARAGRDVLLWPILLGHSNSDPFPNSPLLPRDMSRDSPQMECNRACCMSSSVAGDNSSQGSNAECSMSSSAQEDNSPQGVLASSASSSASSA